MANNFPSTLLPELVHDAAITSLGPVLGMIDSFTHSVVADPIAPGSTVKVGVVTSGATATTNPSTYESGDSTKVQRTVTVDEHNVSFHVSQSELNKGHALNHLISKNLQVIGNAARDTVFAPITEANFGSAVVDKTAATFSAADLKTIWAAAKDFPEKHLLLDGGHYAQLLPTDGQSFRPGETGAFGFDSIRVNNRWNGAGTDIIGFCGARDAIVVASGEPATDAALLNVLDFREEVELPGGLVAYVSSWVSTATRARWMSIGLMLGASLGDADAGKVIEGGLA